jgi:hypothetical protein
MSGTSYTSWISSLAHPAAPTSPRPNPPVTIEVSSPDSSARTVKLSHVPIPGREHGREPDAESKYTEDTVHDEKDLKDLKDELPFLKDDPFKMSTVDELSEHPTTPTTALRGKARSLVDGLVSGIRSLPRAMTHSQMYDRRSAPSTHSSFATSRRTTMTTEHDAAMALRYPTQPVPMGPFFFAPPNFVPGQLMQSPTSMSPPLSKLYSEGELEVETHLDRLGGIISGIKSMPWIAPRPTIDYYPGERSQSIPKKKMSSSWYTIGAPATPSVISHPEQLVPEPWFPPAPLVEVPEEEEVANDEEDDGDPHEPPKEKITRLRAELNEKTQQLQEKTQQLAELRQVLEHEKSHIGQLEIELATLRKEAEEANLLQARKNSVRQSLRARASIRVSRIYD